MADITSRMTAAQYRAEVADKRSAASARKRKAKFGNTRQGQFDSLKEARAYEQFVVMMKATDEAERVVSIEHHVRYEVIPKQPGERAAFYEADFRVTYADGRVEVYDAKSAITRREPKYVLKRKLMLQVHGIKIIEI